MVMRLIPFFAISAAVHAAAVILPISFFTVPDERVVPVMLVSKGGDGGQGSTANRGTSRLNVNIPTQEKQGFNKAGQVEGATEVTDTVTSVAQDSSGEGVMMVGFDHTGTKQLPPTDVDSERAGGRKGENRREKDSGVEIGTGAGKQGGEGKFLEPVFFHPSYAYAPKPQYPERARREGWEGTVLLRVLVDREGGSKWIEVNQSSGFETLDGAAMETVKHWRFEPARYGERRVESWVKIPIIFRLADLRN